MINRAKKSLESRIQALQSRNYEYTSCGRKIVRLKDSHKGEKCIVVCNGPSLKPEDLDRIQSLGIPTFGMNRVCNIFEKTSWRPTYYVSEDILILKGIQDEISKLEAVKFIPVNLKWYEGINVNNAIYFWMDYKSELKETYGLSLNPAHAIRCTGTVTTSCIQLAIYMGFTEIYLIGADHNYSKIIDVNGNVVEDKSVKDYFVEGYDDDIKEQVVHDMRGATKAYAAIEQLSRKLGTFRVYNSTRGGKLEIFERVALDSILVTK